MKELIQESEQQLQKLFHKVEEVEEYNSLKVLNAFKKNNLSEIHFNMTTGYGYDDIGRDTIEKIYADIFQAEDALVRSQFISGSHALTVALFGLLRPGDIMLSITGTPYDTLHEVIGIKENSSSLKSFGVFYEQIDLENNEFNMVKIEEVLKTKKIKLIEIQRSKGYSTRKSITIEKLEKVIQLIKKVSPDTIIMIDNCYCEFVGKKEPIELGADIVVGSLIKNLGAGIAPNGAYIVGKKELIHLCSERLNLPGEAKEVGPSLGMNKSILQGLFMAPSVVASSLKTAILTSKVLEELGYQVDPTYQEERADIVQSIIFNNKEADLSSFEFNEEIYFKEDLIHYVQGIQAGSPIDSNAIPEPWNMPGYDDQVIMASGSFTQGSSIELSCDGPIRPPFIAYQQGGLTYTFGKLGLLKAVERLNHE